MERYRIFDHEADTGFEVYGRTVEELFQNGVYALFSLITDMEAVQPLVEKRIIVNGNGELLINFLNDSLYMWDTEGFIPKTLSIHVGREHAEGVARGEVFNPAKHLIKQEVKAVTYHKFRIVEEKGMLRATVIVDV
jgi:SHS2 domain-containing protein